MLSDSELLFLGIAVVHQWQVNAWSHILLLLYMFHNCILAFKADSWADPLQELSHGKYAE